MSDTRAAAEAAGEIPWRAAHAMVGHVLAEGERRGLRVVVALTDRWGRRLAFQRQPGAVVASAAIAAGKALAACTFDAPTAALLETVSRHDQEELARANPGLAFVGGGLPIRSAGLLLGGIGVSGASAEEDAEIALGALRAGGFDTTFQRAEEQERSR